MRMRVINAEEFEAAPTEFFHQSQEFLVCNLVIPDWINGCVRRRERLSDEPVLPRQNSTTFPMRLAAGVPQELPVYFAAASNDSRHCESI